MAVSGSLVTMTNCDVVRGAGGTGGTGGTGGRGQPGGAGGLSGANPGTVAGGVGGAGGHGGHGGGGGGGAGGMSYAIVRSSGSSVSTSGLTISSGAAGAGGAGGLSAPAAPPVERDGNDGGAGTAGALGTTLVVAGAEPDVADEPGATGARGVAVSQGATGARGVAVSNDATNARGVALSPAGAAQALAACDVGCVTLAVGDDGGAVALAFSGVQPNPITSGSRLYFSLPQDASVRIDVFDASGRRVALVADRAFGAGPQTLDWRDATAGSNLSAGLYFVRLATLGRSFVARVAVLK